MINRGKIKKIQGEYERWGWFPFLVDTVTNLRILEYVDRDGDVVFACPFKHQYFSTIYTHYIINAIDVDRDPEYVKLFCIPKEVFLEIAERVLSDEYSNILEPKTGRVFTIEIVDRGRWWDTYRVGLRKEAYPVGQRILEQVVNPLTTIQNLHPEG